MSLQEHLRGLPEWADDQKCGALFSSFRNRNFEEEDLESWMYKINFWYPLILYTSYRGMLPAKETSIFSFEVATLPVAFRRKGISPLGLPTVISFQMEKGLFYTKHDFFTASSLKIPTNKRDSLFQGLIRNLFRSFLSPFSDGKYSREIPPDSTIVVIENLQKFAHLVFASLPATADIIDSSLSHLDLLELCNKISQENGIPATFSSPGSLDFRILLHFLKTFGKPITIFETTNPKEPVILVSNDGSKAMMADKSTVTNICSLKLTLRLVSSQIEKSEAEQEQLLTEIKNNLHNKTKCLALLRRKNSLLSYEDALQNNKNNIYQIINSIRFAVSSKEMGRSLQLGSSTLKNLLSSVDSKEDIDTLYLDINELISEQKEISSLLTPISTSEIEEEIQLEEELENLLEGERRSKLPLPISQASSSHEPQKLKPPTVQKERALPAHLKEDSVTDILKRMALNQ